MATRKRRTGRRSRRSRQGIGEGMMKSIVRSFARRLGTMLVKLLLRGGR